MTGGVDLYREAIRFVASRLETPRVAWDPHLSKVAIETIRACHSLIAMETERAEERITLMLGATVQR